MAEWWQGQTNPNTGKPWTSYEEANAWAMGKGQKAASSAFNTVGANPAKSSWSAPVGGAAQEWTAPSDWGSLAGRKFKTDASGYPIDAQGNRVVYPGQSNDGGTSIVAGYDAQGFPIYDNSGLDLSHGGTGYLESWTGRDTPGGAITAGLEYISPDVVTGAVRKITGDTGGGAPAASTSTTRSPVAAPSPVIPVGGSSTSTGGTTQVGQNGIFTVPGAGETFYDRNKAFFEQPTETGKAWGQIASQQPEAVQHWNAVRGRYNGTPTDSEGLFASYKADLSNPNYLDEYFAGQADKAQTTLDRKASSAGWADSGAAARATAGIDKDFSNQALLARENFMRTGMDVAGASDASRNQAAATGANMAQGADTSLYDRVRTATSADNAELSRILGGQTAAGDAERLALAREGKGLDSSIQLGQDQALLALQGFSSAQAQQFASDLQALSLQVQRGTLDPQLAYNKAQEMMAGLGMASNSTLNMMLINRLSNNSNNPNNLPLG